MGHQARWLQWLFRLKKHSNTAIALPLSPLLRVIVACWLNSDSGWNPSPLWNSSEIPFRGKCQRHPPVDTGGDISILGVNGPFKSVRLLKHSGGQLFHLWGATTEERVELKRYHPAGFSLKPLKRASKVSVHLTNYHQVNTNLQDKKRKKKRESWTLEVHLLQLIFINTHPLNKLLIIAFIADTRSDKCQSMAGDGRAWWRSEWTRLRGGGGGGRLDHS